MQKYTTQLVCHTLGIYDLNRVHLLAEWTAENVKSAKQFYHFQSLKGVSHPHTPDSAVPGSLLVSKGAEIMFYSDFASIKYVCSSGNVED